LALMSPAGASRKSVSNEVARQKKSMLGDLSSFGVHSTEAKLDVIDAEHNLKAGQVAVTPLTKADLEQKVNIQNT